MMLPYVYTDTGRHTNALPDTQSTGIHTTHKDTDRHTDIHAKIQAGTYKYT